MIMNARKYCFAVPLCVAMAFAFAQYTPAQMPNDGFRKLLIEQTRFADSDLAALDRGEVVIKLLPVNENREIGVFGIVHLRRTDDLSLTRFRNSLTQKHNKSIVAEGEFHTPPLATDIQLLRLGDGDLDDIRKCEIGDCDFKMSAAMLKRLQSGVNWTAPDARDQANAVFRQALFEYVSEYSTRGNDVLIQLIDGKAPIRVADEQRILLDESLFIKEIAPELVKYLANYPGVQLTGVENLLNWSTVKFGFKPTISVTHTTAYEHRNAASSQYFVVNRQIYSSHYIDASVSISMLLNVSADGGTNTYLIFTDLSRSDSLTGPLGGVKRKMIGGQASDRVKDLLKTARIRLEAGVADTQEPDTEENSGSILAILFSMANTPTVLVLSIFVIGGLLVSIFWRVRRSKS